MSWLLRPYTDPALYRAIAYLLLGFPLGIFEYVVVVTGLSFGAGLAITLLGVPVLLATLLLAAALSTFERELAVAVIRRVSAGSGCGCESVTGGRGPRWRSSS